MSGPARSGGDAPSGEVFQIGAEVVAGDGFAGHLTWVVVDPVAGRLTHIVVEPEHRVGLGRLVPVDTVVDPGPPVRLSCTLEELHGRPVAEETAFLPGSGQAGYPAAQVLSWPYFGLGGPGPIGAIASAPTEPVVYDKVPLGEVEVRRGDPVRASDGDIGSVQGLVVDPADGCVTHVLLQEGHLFGRKQVAIPISSIRPGERGGIEVALRREDVKALPPVDLTS